MRRMGYIKSPVGAPLPGQAIEVKNTASGAVVQTGTTDPQGRWEFTLADETIAYTVEIAASGSSQRVAQAPASTEHEYIFVRNGFKTAPGATVELPAGATIGGVGFNQAALDARYYNVGETVANATNAVNATNATTAANATAAATAANATALGGVAAAGYSQTSHGHAYSPDSHAHAGVYADVGHAHAQTYDAKIATTSYAGNGGTSPRGVYTAPAGWKIVGAIIHEQTSVQSVLIVTRPQAGPTIATAATGMFANAGPGSDEVIGGNHVVITGSGDGINVAAASNAALGMNFSGSNYSVIVFLTASGA